MTKTGRRDADEATRRRRNRNASQRPIGAASVARGNESSAGGGPKAGQQGEGHQVLSMASKLAEEPLGATAALLRQRCEVDADAACGLSVLTARRRPSVERQEGGFTTPHQVRRTRKDRGPVPVRPVVGRRCGWCEARRKRSCEWLGLPTAPRRAPLGLFTFEGRGTRKDPEKAHSLMADAASDGHMAAAEWLHRKDGPSPRRPPPPPSPPPVPRVSKKDGPPSPERVSNDGDALRGALSEARAVAAAARVARTAAEDDAKRLRKERDDYRSKLEQAQRLLEVAKKAPRGDALQRRQQARHAEQLSKLGAAHAAANQLC